MKVLFKPKIIFIVLSVLFVIGMVALFYLLLNNKESKIPERAIFVFLQRFRLGV